MSTGKILTPAGLLIYCQTLCNLRFLGNLLLFLFVNVSILSHSRVDRNFLGF
jgi:hypothetical protein